MSIFNRNTKHKKYMNKQEVCEYLDISITLLTHLMEKGKIPFKKIGRRYLFTKKVIDDWASTPDDQQNAAV